MTDNRTTELREKLTEHGVEYTANDGEYVKETCWPYMGELIAAFAEFDNGTTRFACDTWCFTPEQAIAATLGSEREKALEELVRDMWFWGYEGHMDSKSQDWQMKHIDGVLDRMKELGIGVIDE